MGRLAIIGEQTTVVGFALAGALVLTAEDESAVRAAWDGLPDDVDVVILSSAAAAGLGPARTGRSTPLRVVMPA